MIKLIWHVYIYHIILCKLPPGAPRAPYLYGQLIYFCYWFDQDPTIQPLAEQDSDSLQRMIPEVPLWVKNPDYDRVCIYNVSADF